MHFLQFSSYLIISQNWFVSQQSVSFVNGI